MKLKGRVLDHWQAEVFGFFLANFVQAQNATRSFCHFLGNFFYGMVESERKGFVKFGEYLIQVGQLINQDGVPLKCFKRVTLNDYLSSKSSPT